ncbi:NAD(P)H-binding protein [Rhodobacterales bacterium HKCCE2091]|nr:NAD(P)H-binding protein [Rhodobacterales bacterium HKCCE2091]
MKVIVIGATGKMGAVATRKLLADGHEVTAFARHPEALDLADQNLHLHPGDATDAEAVAAAVAGHDAVVVVLGSGMKRRSTIRSAGTLNVIRAMQRHGVRRLVVQSTLGARESWGNLNFFWKRIMFGAYLRPVFLDHELQERLVESSGLDWTIVRPAAFADGPETGVYMEDVKPEARGLRLKITKADIAAFLSRQLTEATYLGRAVGITG